MLFAIAVILILIADQGLKYWVTLSIPLDDGVRALFPGFLELRNIHNSGAAFSLLSGAPRWIFIILAVVFIVIIVLAVRREWVHGAFGRWMAILLLAGALGNCLDRMLSGYVVDMLAFEFWPSFPVFNIADVCIVVGAIGFFLHVVLYKDPETVSKESARRGENQEPKRESRTEVFKPGKVKSAGQTVSPDQPTQRVEMKPKAAKKPAEPKPAEQPAPAPKAESEQPTEPQQPDPFAAWDRAVQTLEKEARVKAAAAAAPEPIPEPKPSDVKPTVAKPKQSASDGFSLEDILAEFSDE